MIFLLARFWSCPKREFYDKEIQYIETDTFDEVACVRDIYCISY